MQRGLAQRAFAAIVLRIRGRAAWCGACAGCIQIPGLQCVVVVIAGGQPGTKCAARVGVKPFAGHAAFACIGVIAVTVGVAPGQHVILAPGAALDALAELHFAGAEAAGGHAQSPVVATGAGQHVHTAGDGMQPVARVVGAAHDLDSRNILRKHRIQVRHAAGIIVAGNAIDQQLDRIDPPLAIEAAERKPPRVGAHAEWSDLYAGRTHQQLPAVVHMLIVQQRAADHVHRTQHARRTLPARGVRVHLHLAQGQCGVLRLCMTRHPACHRQRRRGPHRFQPPHSHVTPFAVRARTTQPHATPARAARSTEEKALQPPSRAQHASRTPAGGARRYGKNSGRSRVAQPQAGSGGPRAPSAGQRSARRACARVGAAGLLGRSCNRHSTTSASAPNRRAASTQ